MIEKSRKLRDLFGASLILSYLSYKLVKQAEKSGLNVISPGSPNIQKGMPNRILLKGKGEFSGNDVANNLQKSWQEILNECRVWIEREVPPKEEYFWQQESMRWGLYTWEIFGGHGDSIESAMKNLETRKLRIDWIAINWIGDSSSLTGTDAIAWPRLGLGFARRHNLSISDRPQRKPRDMATFWRVYWHRHLSRRFRINWFWSLLSNLKRGRIYGLGILQIRPRGSRLSCQIS